MYRMSSTLLCCSLASILLAAGCGGQGDQADEVSVTETGKPSPVPSGSCAVTPNPVAVGADYTITASALAPNELVNVLIEDSSQTTAWNLQSDAAGGLSLTWHSYWTGTSTVSFYDQTGRKRP